MKHKTILAGAFFFCHQMFVQETFIKEKDLTELLKAWSLWKSWQLQHSD